jgi:capsid protein
VELSDADGVLNFYGQQTLRVRSWLDGGEVFIRRRRATRRSWAICRCRCRCN